MKKGGSQVLIVFAFSLSLYLFTAKGRITVIDGLVRYTVTQGIVERGSIALPRAWSPHWRYQINGVPYSFYSLGQSLAGVPFYLIGHLAMSRSQDGVAALDQISQFAYSLINPFMAAGLCAVFFSLCLHLGYSRTTALWLTLMLGFGTILWAQSKDTFEHPQEAFFALAGILFAYRALEEKRRLLYFISGLFFGAALLTRESAIFFFIPTLIYILAASRRYPVKAIAYMSLCLLGVIPFTLIIAWYNLARAGSPFIEGHQATGHFTLFDNPLARGLVGLLFSPGRGVLEYNPVLLILVLFPFSLLLYWRKKRGLSLLFALIILCYLFFYARFRFWDGGLCWGPRYLIPIIPLLLLPLGETFERLNCISTVKKILMVFLVGISVLIQLSSVLVDHQIWFYEVAMRNSQGEHLAINSNLKNSPLLHQWLSLERVLTGKKLPELDRRVISNPSQDFCTGIDFWWLCPPASLGKAFRFGGAGLLALLVLLFGWRLQTGRRPERGNFTPL